MTPFDWPNFSLKFWPDGVAVPVGAGAAVWAKAQLVESRAPAANGRR
jgi:hypothetical protein